MQSVVARTKLQKVSWIILAVALTAALFIGAWAAMVRPAGAAAATHVVDDDGLANGGNCNHASAAAFTTVSAAIAAASPGDTVKVCPGTYAENVVVDKTVTLRGAQKEVETSGRTFASADESTISGLLTIQAADVRVDGFSFTNPGQGLGVIVKTAGNGAALKYNFVQTVGSNTFVGPTVGIYLELGPDNVYITENDISNVQSQTGSAQGILVGDSTSGNPSLNTRIEENTIHDITSVLKGAYGVQANNGASTSPTATGYTEIKVSDNYIHGLTGDWAHAIGLEGETPNAVVQYNVISDLTDVTPTPLNNAIAVFFEANQFFFTSAVTRNNLEVGPAAYGIAVHPVLTALYLSLSLKGECNWWGDASGPGAVASGTGSLVSTGVDYTPWLKKSKLKDC